MATPWRMNAYRISALIFTLLGIGNFLVGLFRHNYYDSKYSTLKPTMTEPSYKDTLYLNRLQSQARFYQLVKGGGVFFLLIAAGILIVERVNQRGKDKE
jgi:hypothetical protein